MNPYEIDISKLDRAEVLAALYNNTTGPLGPPVDLMTRGDAQREIDALLAGEEGRNLYFDYLWHRPLKIHLGRDLLDTRLYDRDHGNSAARMALQPLLAAAGVLDPSITPHTW